MTLSRAYTFAKAADLAKLNKRRIKHTAIGAAESYTYTYHAILVARARGVYRGEWTQLASKLGSGGRELHPEGGRIHSVFVHAK